MMTLYRVQVNGMTGVILSSRLDREGKPVHVVSLDDPSATDNGLYLARPEEIESIESPASTLTSVNHTFTEVMTRGTSIQRESIQRDWPRYQRARTMLTELKRLYLTMDNGSKEQVLMEIRELALMS